MINLNVPVELVKFSLINGYRKPLALFLAIKFYSSGKVNASDMVWHEIRKQVNIKDARTFKKHLNRLRDVGWIGYNPQSGYYFVRSFDKIRARMGFKTRTSSILLQHDLSRVQSWCDAVLINCVIRNQEFYWEKGHRRFKRSALSKNDGASPIHKVDPKTKPAYYGLGTYTIGNHLNCSQAQACKRKRQAEKNGFLTLKKHFKVLLELERPDLLLRQLVEEQHPTLKGRLRFRAISKDGVSIIQLLQQLHDEIIPNTVFSKRKNIGRLVKEPVFNYSMAG